MIIAIELDKTICGSIKEIEEESEVTDCVVNNGVKEFLIKAKKRGHYIKIFTHRLFSLKMATKRWLKINNIDYDELIMNNTKYDLFIGVKVLHYHGCWGCLEMHLNDLEERYG